MNDMIPVPNIETPTTHPIHAVEKVILSYVAEIEAWFRAQWQLTAPPITSSVDLRNAGFKLAPVDTNLFPAGFNNLNPDFLPLCVQAVQAYFLNDYRECRRILILPERHTRNTYYFQSLGVLYDILLKAGFDVRIGNLDLSVDSVQDVVVDSLKLQIVPIKREDNRLKTEGFEPCVIILNNDLSDGIPDILIDLEQPILPSAHMGWSSRTKSNHFKCYEQVIEEFCQIVPIDPWIINPAFQSVSDVDFLNQSGMDRLALETSRLLETIHQQYQLRGITDRPFVVMKADNGTYGMSVMMLHDASTLENMNRRQRNKMSAIKGGKAVDRVILQEGVYTLETTMDGAVAEPVVYMIGQYVVGGFYRVHNARGDNENLNAPGMHFEPLAFAKPCNMPCGGDQNKMQNNRFYVYGVMARLAALAAARESQNL